jgi:hypothetical protein
MELPSLRVGGAGVVEVWMLELVISRSLDLVQASH